MELVMSVLIKSAYVFLLGAAMSAPAFAACSTARQMKVCTILQGIQGYGNVEGGGSVTSSLVGARSYRLDLFECSPGSNCA